MKTFRWSPVGVAMIVAVICMGHLVNLVATPREAVRVRNSLISAAVEESALDWIPGSYPEDFLVNRSSAPDSFLAAARDMGPVGASSLDKSIALARHLTQGHRKGRPIQASTEETYRIIRDKGLGYCADFTQVFNGLAAAANLSVREWGISFDGFGGDGHAFNEIYDESRRAWVMVDSFHAFVPVDRGSQWPLSALQFRDRLRLDDPLESMSIFVLDQERFPFDEMSELVTYYRRGTEQMYLWWGTNVFDYDSNPVVAAAGRISRSLEQVVAILLGIHPKIRIVSTANNAQLIADLRSLRAFVLADLLGLFAALGFGLGWLIWEVRRVRRVRMSAR